MKKTNVIAISLFNLEQPILVKNISVEISEELEKIIIIAKSDNMNDLYDVAFTYKCTDKRSRTERTKAHLGVSNIYGRPHVCLRNPYRQDGFFITEIKIK